MENPKRSLAQLQAVELQGEDILKDQTEIIALDRRRNSNREALRALTKEKGKTWFALGPMLIKMPVEKATDLLKKGMCILFLVEICSLYTYTLKLRNV